MSMAASPHQGEKVMRITVALLASALMFAAAPVFADVTELRADSQKQFKHNPSGIVIAASAAGIQRTKVEEFDDKQLDVAAEFRSPDDKEITTIYVFRRVTGDVPLWFDRIQNAIEARESFKSPTVAIPAAPFTPAGQSNARALKVVYSAGGPPWKSSAAALTTTGEWYVAVRASSQTLTPDQLLARLDETFGAIKWPKEKAPAANAYVIGDCPDALPQGPDAEPAAADGSVILMAALAANVGGSSKDAGEVKPPRWCRDPDKMTGAGIYRPDAAKDRFFVAFQDSGRGIMVEPNELAGLLAGAKNNAPLTYTVEMVDIDRRIGFGSFKSLPSFAQAIWLTEHGNRAYSATTWGKNKNIDISSDAVK